MRNEQNINQQELLNNTPEVQAPEINQPEDSTAVITDAPVSASSKFTKKKIAIIAAAAVAVIAVALVFLIPSKFEKVRRECVQIAGTVTGSGDYFMLDTLPDIYENMDETVKAMLLPRAQW